MYDFARLVVSLVVTSTADIAPDLYRVRMLRENSTFPARARGSDVNRSLATRCLARHLNDRRALLKHCENRARKIFFSFNL